MAYVEADPNLDEAQKANRARTWATLETLVKELVKEE